MGCGLGVVGVELAVLISVHDDQTTTSGCILVSEILRRASICNLGDINMLRLDENVGDTVSMGSFQSKLPSLKSGSQGSDLRLVNALHSDQSGICEPGVGKVVGGISKF